MRILHDDCKFTTTAACWSQTRLPVLKCELGMKRIGQALPKLQRDYSPQALERK